MKQCGPRFTNTELLNILSLSKNATAIYSTEDILIQTANDAMLAFWGKDRSVIGKILEEAVPELKDQPFIDILQNVWNTGITYEAAETPAELTIDGKLQVFYFDFEYRAIKDAAGNMLCILHTATDITDRVKNKLLLKQTEEQQQALEREQALHEGLAITNEELRTVNEELYDAQVRLNSLNNELEERVSIRTEQLEDSEIRLRSMFDQAPLALCILHGPDLIIDLANDRILKLWNKTTDVLGRPYRQVRNSPQTAPYLTILDNVYTTGIPYHRQEVKAYTAPGNKNEWGYFSFTYQPIKDKAGNTTSVLVVVDDVTDAVTSRMEKKQFEQRLQVAIEAADFGTWQVDTQTRALVASPRFKELFGFYTHEEITISDCIAQITEDYREFITHTFEKAITQGGDYDLTFSIAGYHDNIFRWVRAKGSLSTDETTAFSAFTGVIIDMTEQVLATQAIQKLNEDLATVNEEQVAINEELASANEQQRAINEELVQSQNEYLAVYNQLVKNQADLLFTLNAASLATWDLNPVTGRFSGNDLLKTWFGLVPEDEIELQKATAAIAEADRPHVINAIQKALQFQSGGHYDIEYTIIHPHNLTPRMVRAKGKTKFNGDGEPIRLSGILQDITEQKKDDQRKNDFIGMVSHEMKTPITSLSGYLQLLQMNANKEDGFTTSMLSKANKQINKITTLINGFLNVTRLESGKIQIDKQHFNMADLVKEMEEEITSTTISHQITFHPVETIYVHADKDKIGQVISNLISNAIKYSPAGTPINICCVAAGGNAEVSVTDEGIGIKEEDQSKLFDRYYRVNEGSSIASGFGIGLYLCAEIIHRHDGKIWVASEVGKGSTFYFSLPVIQ